MAKEYALSTDNLPLGGFQRNSVASIADSPNMTSAVGCGCKAPTQPTNDLQTANYNTTIHCQHGWVRVLIGIYHVHLKEFFRVFPKEHVLVVKLEEYSKDPATAMANIFRFLDLNENVKLRKDVNSTKHANPRCKDDRLKGGMWDKTRSLLQDFYKPHNTELFILLNDEKFNYNFMYS